MADTQASRPGPVAATLKAWGLNLVCPGLGQMMLGAKLRGAVTLVVVVGSLGWLGWVDYVAIDQFFGGRTPAGGLEPTEALKLVSDPAFWEKLKDVSLVPGWVFFLSFLYAFVDSAYLAFAKRD